MDAFAGTVRSTPISGHIELNAVTGAAFSWASQAAQWAKNPSAMQERQETCV